MKRSIYAQLSLQLSDIKAYSGRWDVLTNSKLNGTYVTFNILINTLMIYDEDDDDDDDDDDDANDSSKNRSDSSTDFGTI